MINSNAQPAARYSTAVDPLNVLAWLDEDRILLKDRTRQGLHRRVIARKGDMPDAEVWVAAVAIADKIDRERITHRFVQYGEFWFLWIFWKEKP